MHNEMKLCIQSKDESTVDDDMAIMKVSTDDMGMNVGTRMNLTRTLTDSTVDTSLARFLARPVLINTTTWTEGASYSLDIDPWYLFFGSTPIRKKIDNYAFIRCNLKVRFMISASPFYYGAAQISYNPLPAFSTDLDDYGGLIIVPLSQRPNITLLPASSSGGTLTLPFLYYKEWLDLTRADDLIAMGNILGYGYTNLLNANSVVGDNCTVQVFAWAEDVELSGSTISLAVEGKDEYSPNGIISRPASSIAYYMGQLSSWPIIGPFATATSIASGAISSIASLFGYTNVPNISDVSAYRPTTNPLLATTDISCPYEKLTLDSKNELTVDSMAYGVTPGDDLSISSLVGRQSYYAQFIWAGSDAAEYRLFSCRVNPAIHAKNTTGANVSLYGTPMWMVANMFRYWRGDIKFRFQIIASKFHRGKIRITWDPVGNLTATADSYTQAFSKIVDITEENDVEVIIPYNQTTAFLPVPSLSGTSASQFGDGSLTKDPGDNGILSIRVLNVQTSPIATANITVLCWVSGMPNMEFADPTEVSNTFNPYIIQSKDEELSREISTCPLGATLGSTPNHLNLTYFGEKIVSLRTLIRRSTFYLSQSPTKAYDGFIFMRNVMSRLPIYPGYDPEGIHANSTAVAYNYVGWTNLNWVSYCFVGIRGSVMYNINPGGELINGNLLVSRAPRTLTSANYSVVDGSVDAALGGFSTNARLMINTFDAGQSGLSITNGNTQTSLAVSVPMYSIYKFLPTDIYKRTEGDTDYNTHNDSFEVGTFFQSSAINNAAKNFMMYYCSAGTDMDFVFFLNVPQVFIYTRPAAP